MCIFVAVRRFASSQTVPRETNCANLTNPWNLLQQPAGCGQSGKSVWKTCFPMLWPAAAHYVLVSLYVVIHSFLFLATMCLYGMLACQTYTKSMLLRFVYRLIDLIRMLPGRFMCIYVRRKIRQFELLFLLCACWKVNVNI